MKQAEGRIIHALINDGRARVLAVVAPGAAEETRQRHGLGPKAALLAAEGLVANLLLAAHIKGEERLLLQVQCEHPRFAFSGEVSSDGGVRARLTPPVVTGDGPLIGSMLAIKSVVRKELYRGIAELQDSFERSLQGYLVSSQQSRGVVRLGARADDEGRVVFASGLLVEQVADTMDKAEFDTWIAPLADLPLEDLMTGFAFGELLGHKVEVLQSAPVRFQCSCSQERVESMLKALDQAQLQAMYEEDGQAEVTCHFCNTAYMVGGDRLQEMLTQG